MKQIILILLTSFFLFSCASQTDRTRYLPPTISTKSRVFLEFASPFTDGKPTTIAKWARLQKLYNQALIILSANRVHYPLSQSIVSTNIAQIPVIIVTPKKIAPEDQDKVIIYIHGGAYVFGSARSTLGCAKQVAHYSKMKVISVDYHLAPQYPYPVGLNDNLAVYLELIKKYAPSSIGLIGDSAGGALCLSLALKLRDNELPMPKAMVLMSPWTDINRIGDSYYTLEGADPILSYNGNLEHAVKVYVGKSNKKHPYISPIYANFDGDFPATLIQVGTREIFLSNAVRLDQRLRKFGQNSKLSVFEGMWHIFQYYPPKTKEAKLAHTEISKFFHQNLE